MKYFPIKTFTGIETNRDSSDQDRGTLRRADGVIPFPPGALSSGPTWASAWGLSTLGASIASALSGADAAKVHFVLVTRSGHTLLVAWDLAASRPRGMWHVAGTGDPSFSSTGSVTITATTGTVYRDKTAALTWYGSWIGSRLLLGNGTDANLVWSAGTLALLFPTAGTNTYDGNKAAIPPCKSFVADADGVIYAAGNVTTPRRVWLTEKPSAAFPTPYGLYDTDTSFVDLLPAAGGTAVTALTLNGPFVVAHLDEGGAVALWGWERGSNGYKCLQQGTQAPVGAINPACAYSKNHGPFYLGADLEVYRPPKAGGWGLRNDTATLATNRSSGEWNAQLSSTVTSADTFTLFDQNNTRLWMWAPLAVGRQGLYVYDSGLFSITGPWRYPDFLAVTQVRDPNLGGFQAVGLTRNGALLWADLDLPATVTLPAVGTAQGTDYTTSATAVSSDTGLPGVEIDAANEVFRQTLATETVHMASAWGAFVGTTAPTPTEYFKNAYLAIVDVCDEDFGTPVMTKQFCELRLQFERNQRVYFGVASEADQQNFTWFGCPYPDKEAVVPLEVSGTRLKLRLILVCFNASRCVLPDMTVGVLESRHGR